MKYGLLTVDDDGNIVDVWNFAELHKALDAIDSDKESTVDGEICERVSGCNHCPVCIPREDDRKCRSSELQTGADFIDHDVLVHILSHGGSLDMHCLVSGEDEGLSDIPPLEGPTDFIDRQAGDVEIGSGNAVSLEQAARATHLWRHQSTLPVPGGLPLSCLEVISNVFLLRVICICAGVCDSTWLELLRYLLQKYFEGAFKMDHRD